MHSFFFYIQCLVLLPGLSLALPHDLLRTRLGRSALEIDAFTAPIYSRKAGGVGAGQKRGTYSGFYTVPITIGNTLTAVNLDTGSSDLWIVTDACKTQVCRHSNLPPYPSAQVKPAGGSVALQYGDSLTGTHANGPVAQNTATIAGLSMPEQPFGAISDTNNTSIINGGDGIFGLGFPASSQVQAAVINNKFNNPSQTDDFVDGTSAYGPLLSRLAMKELTQELDQISLQRDTIDIGGQTGALTVGKLPDGVDNSSLTWVPVRMYSSKNGGLNPPQDNPNEIYPLRWEVPLDGVYLDGQKLADSTIRPTGISSPGLSALIDTGNSLIRGPEDIIDSILKSVSPAFAANSNALPTYPCATPHTMAFQIGGKMFPIDPRDFVSQNDTGDVTNCIANNIVSTDPPSVGALFSWSLGDPFFKSTLVAFYFGNLTHPSVDPPRIGFMSSVPSNATAELTEAVDDAKSNGGNFEKFSDLPSGAYRISICRLRHALIRTNSHRRIVQRTHCEANLRIGHTRQNTERRSANRAHRQYDRCLNTLILNPRLDLADCILISGTVSHHALLSRTSNYSGQ
ncbi:hypothetical protein EWM64_g166 [Hericium alpestre]|uniref:Peptidase A1 domain-containing protein n=1 Tax=Hericium alpestre TaxID=135208 RepID=A0A4Z0ACI3_9AGAM|nr:hypothetical protein EWM64_g166 [Hericium alpestre]